MSFVLFFYKIVQITWPLTTDSQKSDITHDSIAACFRYSGIFNYDLFFYKFSSTFDGDGIEN